MMNQILETKLNNLPASPGVYQFLNEKKKIIYVGKAKNLRNRVKSYFHSGITSPKILAMVKKIDDFELIITSTEIEALILENTLIKEFKPRYNINLKDDKSFPYIRVTNEMFPRIFPTRRIVRDGSKYFGPFTEVRSMKNSLRMINQIFKIRSCRLDIDQKSIDKKKFKVCLDYHIKKCDGPCEGLISETEYKEMVGEVVKLLHGKTDELIKDLKIKMNVASSELNFEEAASIRNKIAQLSSLSERQVVVSEDLKDRDIIAIAKEEKDAACSILNVRQGKLVGKKQLKLSVDENEELAEIYSSVIKMYYNELVEIPNEIALEVEIEDAEIVLDWLRTISKKNVKFHIPKKGLLHTFLKMSKENASLQLKEIQLQRMKREGAVSYTLSALKRDLRLKNIPNKIECFDISNLQGTDTVASMVVFENGKPKRSLYRKFIIKSVNGPDDFESMNEVITRRYKRLLEEKETLPELIMVDGGKGQLSSAVFALRKLEIQNYDIIGLAKRLEEIFLPNESDAILLPKTSSSLKLLQQIRDEAHRFAIEFHRLRRSKRTLTSELTEINGIGEELANKLLRELGSVEEIKNADHEKLKSVVGKSKAEKILKHFAQN